MGRVITITQLQERNIQLVSELNPFYQIYHQYIICNLTPMQITGYVRQAIQQPVWYDIIDKHCFIFNQLLLFYLLYDYENHASLLIADRVVLQKIGDRNKVTLKVFFEMIDVIKQNKRSLPIKTLFHKLKTLLNPNDCQNICQKNIFTRKAYCNLLDISIATFKLAN